MQKVVLQIGVVFLQVFVGAFQVVNSRCVRVNLFFIGCNDGIFAPNIRLSGRQFTCQNAADGKGNREAYAQQRKQGRTRLFRRLVVFSRATGQYPQSQGMPVATRQPQAGQVYHVSVIGGGEMGCTGEIFCGANDETASDRGG